MKKSFIFSILVSPFLGLASSHALTVKPCQVGLMSCQDYCSGALVIKIYQLMGQAFKPLCNITPIYRKQAPGVCQVKLLKAKQSFDQKALLNIALAKDWQDFNKMLSNDFRQAIFRCPKR